MPELWASSLWLVMVSGISCLQWTGHYRTCKCSQTINQLLQCFWFCSVVIYICSVETRAIYRQRLESLFYVYDGCRNISNPLQNWTRPPLPSVYVTAHLKKYFPAHGPISSEWYLQTVCRFDRLIFVSNAVTISTDMLLELFLYINWNKHYCLQSKILMSQELLCATIIGWRTATYATVGFFSSPLLQLEVT